MLIPSSRNIELPVLRLGLAGFSAAEQALLNLVLASRASHSRISWQLAQLGEADAWCVSGSHAQRLPDGTLRIVPGLPSGRSIRINLDQIDWPIAFSTSSGAPAFECGYGFRADCAQSIQAVLDQLEGWLRPLMVQFYLASQIVEKKLDLRSGVFHVSVHGKLYAMVSLRSGIGVWPIADPADLQHAVWSHRPESADAIPSHFVRTDYSQLMWQYATRTTRDCLPPHYRTKLLFLRRPPHLPMRLLNDPSLLLMRELGYSPGTFAELAQRTGIADAQLSRHLGALYMVGAITADPRRAPAPRAVLENVDWDSPSSMSPDIDSISGGEMTVRMTASGATAPRARGLSQRAATAPQGRED